MEDSIFPARALRVVICGGGASAVLLLNALRARYIGALEVTVIEPREQLGIGVAYSTSSALHLLNTRAGNMSATEQPDDFLQWLRREHPRRPVNWNRNDFAPRRLYGRYLQARLRDARAARNIRFKWLRSTADSIIARGSEWEVVPSQGEPLFADAVVLATGNEAPRALIPFSMPQGRSFVVDDPWDAQSKGDIARDAPVLLVGTGLTAIDIIVELLERGHIGPIYAASRRGLLPRRHGPVSTQLDGCGVTLPSSLRELVRHVRIRIESDPRGQTWPGFINELRSVAPTLWARWSYSERRRFLRHVRPFWDANRHRIAPLIDSRIERAQARGQLKILRGRIREVEPLPLETGVRVGLYGASGKQSLEVAKVINCTGPEMDVRRTANPLLQNLIGDSLAQADPLGLGLVVDQHLRVIAPDGTAHRALHALGSLTRGSRWEVTAIAEIRDQAAAVARRLAREFGLASNCGARLAPVGIYPHAAV